MPTVIGEDRDLARTFMARRDERSFRTLYRRHTPALYLLARRLLGTAGEGAEDAVQETWIRASMKLETFRWESSLRTWLSAILILCCREIIRARGRMASSSLGRETREAAAGSALSISEQRSRAIDLDRALSRLPDGYREVLVLHDVEGYTHDEIAARLGISDGTSKSQLFKARRLLRVFLEVRQRRAEDIATRDR